MTTGYIGTCTPMRQAIHVRAAPDGQIIGALRYGDSLYVVVHCGKWLRVEFGGVEAWVAAWVVNLTMFKRGV